MVGVMMLYRVALPVPLPSHRLILGAILATTVFVVATLGLRFYLKWITSTGYTYGALSTPIAFLLFAFFGGFAIMLGAELNAAIQEEFPAPKTHAHRLRNWLVARLRIQHFSDRTRRRRSTILRQQSRRPDQPALECFVDPLAIRTDRRARLGRPRDGKYLTTQRDDVAAHDGALGDPVLLDVVEVLRGIAAGPVIDAFVGIGAFDRLGLHT